MEQKISKWYTIIEAVDIQTGELIEKTKVENKEYIIIKRTEKYEITSNHGIRTITWECEPNRQQRLEL